ncbi:serine protease [uncultured Fibrella sp.]|uniref:S1 family peptidase n=1 Tax=uncultured Fibrella sp. TaxID=1284596 RepID=UPI0035CBC83D
MKAALLSLLMFLSVGAYAQLIVFSNRPGSKKNTVNKTVQETKLSLQINRNKKCIVKVLTEGGSGTGFFISNEGYIATNYHVIENAYKAKTSIVIGLAMPNYINGSFRLIGHFLHVNGTIAAIDSIHDIAILKLRVNPFKEKLPFNTLDGKKRTFMYGLPKFSKYDLSEGLAIFALGYPLNEPTFITNSGIISSTFGKYQYKDFWPANFKGDGDFSFDRSAYYFDDSAYYADMQINHGNSGGPVFSTTSGEIIGVAVAFKPAQPERILINTANDEYKNLLQLYKSSSNPEIKQLIESIVNLETFSESNSGLSVIIPIRFVFDLLKSSKL